MDVLFGQGYQLTQMKRLYQDTDFASNETIGVLFFGIGLLQAISFQLAGRLAGRIGLVRTMVFTHLPSNVLFAGVAFAPNLTVAIVLLLARHLLSQMDVPVRQALVITVVEPDE